MITRREVALGGLLSIGWLAVPCGCPAHAAPQNNRYGCEAAADEVSFGLTSEQVAFGPTGKPRYLESGDRDLDYALAQTLSLLTDTWKVLPGFAYYDDSAAMNAIATPRRWLSRADGTVLLGRRMLATVLRGDHPDALVSAVVAHEFGHIAQFKYNLKNMLLAGQRSVKRMELHADFLAGYFAGVRKLQKPDFPASAYAVLGRALGSYSTERVDHHGTPSERASAIVKGFEASYQQRRSPGEALQIGVRYVQSV